MPKIEAPLGGAEVDTSDPAGSALSIVYAIIGFGLLFTVMAFGRNAGQFMQNTVSNLTGVETNETPAFEVV